MSTSQLLSKMNVGDLGIVCIALSIVLYTSSYLHWLTKYLIGMLICLQRRQKWPHMALASLETKDRESGTFCGSLKYTEDKIRVHKLLYPVPFIRINIQTYTWVSIGSSFSSWVSIRAEHQIHRHIESSSWSALLTSPCLPKLYFLSLISSFLERLPWWPGLWNSESLQQFLSVPPGWYLSHARAKPPILWWTENLM